MKDKFKQQYLSYLCQVINSSFSLEELKMLCFELGIDIEDLPAHGKKNKVMELVAFLERRKQINQLVIYCREERPNVYWEAVPNALLQNAIENYQKAQNLIEESIDFVDKLFPFVIRSSKVNQLNIIIDKLINYINHLDEKGEKIEEDDLLQIVSKFIEESNTFEAINSIEADISFSVKIDFEDREDALRALNNIAKDQHKLFNKIFKKIHPDLTLVTKALGETPELDRIMRVELTSRLITLKDEDDILKLLVGLFDIIHQAGISYDEVGISNQDVIEVAKTIEDFNFLEKQQNQIHEVLEDFGIDIGDQKASIAKIHGFTQRAEQKKRSKVLNLKLIIHNASCLNHVDREALVSKIMILLESGLNIKIMK